MWSDKDAGRPMHPRTYMMSHITGAFVFQWRSKRRAFGACIFVSAESIASSLSGAHVFSISSISRLVSLFALRSLSRKNDIAVKSVDNLDIFCNHGVLLLSLELRTFHGLIVKNYNQLFVNFFPSHPALLTAFHRQQQQQQLATQSVPVETCLLVQAIILRALEHKNTTIITFFCFL